MLIAIVVLLLLGQNLQEMRTGKTSPYVRCTVQLHPLTGIQEKIDILKRKCLYDDAIKLAKNNQDDHMKLIRAYGDHLCNKGAIQITMNYLKIKICNNHYY